MDFLSNFFARGGFLPHGYCFTWSPPLLWSMVTADLVIAASYFSIPVAILAFARRRAELAGSLLPWLFSAFIFACGTTHLMDVWTIWTPDYGLQALSKGTTAVVSLATALAIWPLIPKALRLPSVREQQATIALLEAEVSRRRSAEESLFDVQQNLAVTLDSIGAGFIATDRAGHVTRMNGAAEKIAGWSEEQARGQRYFDVLTVEGRTPEVLASNPVDYVLAQGITIEQQFDVVAVASGGTRTLLEVRAAPTRSEDGELRGMAVVFRDMTRLRDAESDARRLAAIVSSSNDAIVSKTLDGTITSWNAAAVELFGYTPQEAIGRSILMLIPSECIDEEARIIADISRGKEVRSFDTRRVTRDGRTIDVSVTISPVRDARGRIAGASKIVRDLSPLVQAQIEVQRLEAENRQVQEASRLKSQFLANMSHELRTPLNAIIGFADILATGAVPQSSPKHQTFLGHIATSGRHLLQLINDVLDLSKVESGKFDFSPEPMRLAEVVQQVSNVLHPDLQRKRLSIETAVDPSVDELMLDPARLKQVLFNFLSNAVKFTGEGGLITVRALPQGPHHFRLQVEDTGIGIAEGDIDKLFVEFQQLDAGHDKQHQGTGLGLALTRRLVQAQGGTAGVTSVLGEGSVFYVVLNRAHGHDANMAGAATGAASFATMPRMLAIEEQTRSPTPVVRSLSEAGVAVDVAVTADEAVARAQARPYDAMTLDLRLGEEAGLDALARIRGGGANRSTPVIGLSARLPMGSGPISPWPTCSRSRSAPKRSCMRWRHSGWPTGAARTCSSSTTIRSRSS